MKRLILYSLFMLVYTTSNGQAVYADPALTAMLSVNGAMLQSEQQTTNKQLEEINAKQTGISGLLYSINDTQKKLHKGLTEVNSVVRDAVSLTRAYSNLEKATEYSRDAVNLARRNPHHLSLATSELNRIQESALEVYANVASIITSQGGALMTSGERRQLIRAIENQTYKMRISSLVLKNQLQRINRVGFLNTLNPFDRNFRNRDLETFTDILRQNGM